MFTIRTSRRNSAAFLASLALTALAQAQDGTTGGPKPAPPADAIVFYSAGLESVLVDPKDQVLVKALRLMDQRLMELPHETGDEEIPAPALKLILNLLMGPMQLRAGLLDDMPENGPPFYAQWNFIQPNQQAADEIAGRFQGFVTMMGPLPPNAIQPAPNEPGMQMVNLDGPNAYFGATKLGNTPAFTLALSRLDHSPVNPEAISPLKGVKPAMAMSMDFKRVQPLFDMLMQHHHDGENGEAEMIRDHLKVMGLYGPDAMSITGAVGYDSDRARATVRFAGLGKTLKNNTTNPLRKLTAADLKRIPADATFAQISTYDFASIGPMLQRAMPKGEDAPPDPMAMIEQATGVHPQRDIFDHLGQVVGCYASDTTGGGGLLSMAMFVEVKNAEALGQTITHLTAMMNQMAQQAAKGYIRLGERTVKNQKMNVLSFPGIPIPIEISYAIADGYLYAAASPQALLGAIAQGKGGASGLADNSRFKEMGGSDLKDAVKVSFVDTPRLMRDGYGLVSLGVSAMCNAVRSPTDPDRGADLLMPSLAELSSGAKASVTITRIEGDDLVCSAQMDRSLLVNVSGCIGALGGSTGTMVMAALGSGIILPALGKARESAKNTKSMAQLRQISMGVMTYTAEFDDQLPASADILVEKGYLTEDILHSPDGPCSDGRGDYFLHFWKGTMTKVLHPDRTIMGYDRAMLSNHGSTAVLYYDGHVESLDYGQFKDLISQPQHEGIDFHVPE